jgi:Flp pilus assembly CpaE family ATPase
LCSDSNRYDPHLKAYTHDKIREMLGAPNVVTISNDYNAAIHAINSGQPLRKAAPETPILRDLDGLIRSLLGVEEEPAEKRNGLLRRVKRALSL